jgi:putative tricarboxylic transport membrane protein
MYSTPPSLQNIYFVYWMPVGSMVGVLPGIGPWLSCPSNTVTYGLDVTGAIIMLAGIYYGAMFGGSTTSI